MDEEQEKLYGTTSILINVDVIAITLGPNNGKF